MLIIRMILFALILFAPIRSYGESFYQVLANPEKFLDEKIFLVGFLVKKSEIELYPTREEVLIPRSTEGILVDSFGSRIKRHELECYNTYVSIVGVVKSADPIVLDEIVNITRINKEQKFNPDDLCWSYKKIKGNQRGQRH